MKMQYPSLLVIINNENAKSKTECNNNTARNRYVARRYHYLRQNAFLKENEYKTSIQILISTIQRPQVQSKNDKEKLFEERSNY